MSSKKNIDVDATQDALPQDFESALGELEKCVIAMEKDNLSLEASLQAYQRGVALAQICQLRLSAAQKKVQVLESDLLKPLSLNGGENSGT